MIGFESIDEDHNARCIWWSRMCVWSYFWLLYGEGILRKWVLPEYSAPLAVVRDPFLIMAAILCMRAHVFPWNTFSKILTFIALASFIAGLMADSVSIVVVLNGLRTDFLHFYLIFLMPALLTREDVDKMARYSLMLLPVVAVIMVWQFYSPPDSWLNKTTGLSAEVHQLGGTFGNIRPPSLFTFISGVAEYLTMASAFLLAAVIGRLDLDFHWKALASAGLMVAIAVSISRYALGGAALVIICFVIYALIRPNMASQLLILAVVGIFGVFVLLQLGFLEKSINAFTERVHLASQNEGGFGGFFVRIAANFVDPIAAWADQPILGLGVGSLTNAGSLLTVGNLANLQVENELSRLLMEGGLIMGPAFILWRVVLGFHLIGRAFHVAHLYGEPLAWLLIPIAGQLVLIGQLGRPTTLGFMAFTAGLCLTIIHHAEQDFAEDLPEQS